MTTRYDRYVCTVWTYLSMWPETAFFLPVIMGTEELCCDDMNRFIMASCWYRCWCVYEGCSPKLSSSSCRNSKLSRVIGLLLVLKNALINMLVAEKPAAADEDDDEETSDDEVMAISFWDASRNIMPPDASAAAHMRKLNTGRWTTVHCRRRGGLHNDGWWWRRWCRGFVVVRRGGTSVKHDEFGNVLMVTRSLCKYTHYFVYYTNNICFAADFPASAAIFPVDSPGTPFLVRDAQFTNFRSPSLCDAPPR